MSSTYSDYTIIPVGDHCAGPLLLRELGLRKSSYPFDWTTFVQELHASNILHNVLLIQELKSETIQHVVEKYVGNAFDDKSRNRINSNTLAFYHDEGTKQEILEKYTRRFTRLKNDLHNKNIFLLVTRYYYMPEDTFRNIMEILLSYNRESIIVFVSGMHHEYFDTTYKDTTNIIFRHIYYDVTKYYAYDTIFRNNLKIFLQNLLLK